MDRRLALFFLGLGAAVAAWFLLRSERVAWSLGPGRDRAPGEGERSRRCAGITLGGSRCTREAEPPSPFCWQHG